MLDITPLLVDQKKRFRHFHKLNLEEVNLLRSSDNPEYLAKEFDRIFLKIQRLVSYSTIKNEDEKSKIEERTNNLLKKFLNYLKGKTLPKKIEGEHKTIFRDICDFINFFDGDTYFTKIHNSIPKTTIRKFNDKSVGEQFFQISYGREWGLNGMPEGGSCSYRTLLFYNFFNKLKEAGLDLDIKLFRYKNLDDIIVNAPTMRHSGLIVTFQGEDYFVDYEGIHIKGDGEPIVRKLQPYIDVKKEEKNENNEKFFENFKHENMKETDKIIFFDNTEDFVKHVEKYPTYQRIAFYLPRGESERPDRIDFEFIKNGIGIAVNWHRTIFYLRDNNLSKKDFPGSISKKLGFVKDKTGIHKITEENRKLFERFFSVVKDKINIDWLYDNFTTGIKWKSIIADVMGTPKVIMMQK